MNRHISPNGSTPTYTNGHNETSLDISEVSLRPPAYVQPLTTFLPDLPVRNNSALLYGLHRFHLGGLPISRYVLALWFVVALFAFVGVIPGRWFTMTLALLLVLGQIILSRRIRSQKYVHFENAPLPALQESALEPDEKLPIYATGLLSVEGRHQHFSALPGFYRTFATGEHAVLCRATQRFWLGLLRWPADEVGMWYAFVSPSEIESLTWGKLTFGDTTYPAIAMDYRLEIPPGPRRKHAEMRQETIYLAAPEESDVRRIYIDLLDNLPAEKQVTSLTTSV